MKIPTEAREKPDPVAVGSPKPREESLPGEDKPSGQEELRFPQLDADGVTEPPKPADKLVELNQDKPNNKEEALPCLPIPDDTCPVEVVPKMAGAFDILSSRGDDISHFFD